MSVNFDVFIKNLLRLWYEKILLLTSINLWGDYPLINRSRRAPNLKNRVDSETEQAVIKYAIDFPAHGQVRTSNELRKLGVFISPSGVRSIWLRNDLENFKKRLIALEKQAAENGIILTDEQVAALERKKHDDEACGEIETAHPG
ncbi:IS481 family transposase, partial [Vibrio cholerae]